MYHPLIIQMIAEDRISESHRIADRKREARQARQRSSALRRDGEARTPAALRLLPASLRPRLT